jgi:murein DD-endopeptidase MepM/ murein hydrolase activator NlpD
MKKLVAVKSGLILFLFLAVSSITPVNAQIDRGRNEKIEIIESMNDSADLVSGFYSFYDSLIVFFSDAEEIYEFWDNDAIHYSRLDSAATSRVLKMADSTFLLLRDTHAGQQYAHPWHGEVTSRFGFRRYRFHYGIDLNLNTGDTLVAAFDGKIRVTKMHRGYGRVLVIRHDNGLETLYAHLHKFLVDTNARVKAGDPIALGGNSGRSTGSHLHLEIRYLGAAINPEKVIDFETGDLISDTLMISKSIFDYVPELTNLKSAKHYSVRKGDTLSAIARRHGTSVKALCRLNGIRETTILQVGKKLRVR